MLRAPWHVTSDLTPHVASCPAIEFRSPRRLALTQLIDGGGEAPLERGRHPTALAAVVAAEHAVIGMFSPVVRLVIIHVIKLSLLRSE